MDIARPDQKKKKQRRQIIYAVVGLIALASVTMGLQQLKPAAPLVENAYLGTVERGPMLREVRGPGKLVPEEIRWVPAASAGRVDKILVKVGAQVEADTILVELSNPEVEQAAFDAKYALEAAEAQLARLRVDLQTQKLTQQAALAQAEANFSRAKLEFEVNDELEKSGLVPKLTLKKAKADAEELEKLRNIELERLTMSADAANAQLLVQQATVNQLKAQYELRQRQVELLKVRSGIDGVLQKLGDQSPLQIGQQLAAGANLARVANPKKLKAEIKIVETQIRDVTFGQKAVIDMRNNTLVTGKVTRIDPAADQGTFTVDVSFDGDLPREARPDLSVDGTVELERLDDVVYVVRPVHTQSESSATLFKLVLPGKEAVRVPVKLGRSSVQYIEVVEGLQPGDRIVLSDMSAFDSHDRVRVN